MNRHKIIVATGIASLLVSTTAKGTTLAQKCEIAKARAIGREQECLMAEHAKALAARPADPSRCSSAFSKSFATAEGRGGCRTTGDTASVGGRIAAVEDLLAQEISGNAFCGDGMANGPEQCDGADLVGETCVSRGLAGGTLGCTSDCRLDFSGCLTAICGDGRAESNESCDGTDLRSETCQTQGYAYGALRCNGVCLLDTSGCTNSRFVDNNDGTITDEQTGLMWEKKSADGSIHEVGSSYTWSTNGYDPDGSVFTDFLSDLNAGAGFANHTDWRLPTITELETIIDYDEGDPATPGAFDSDCVRPCSVTTCSCTSLWRYWSSTTEAGVATDAWFASFYDNFFATAFLNTGGWVFYDLKTTYGSVRAVRTR